VIGRIYISYRRGDDESAAGRLYDQLLPHFDREQLQLFINLDAIEPAGFDLVKLEERVAACIALIAVIGPRWLNAQNNDGAPSNPLDDPTDYVRVEIESALKRDIRVIPVLVDGASMPRPSDLPPSLQALARRNAVEIAHHRFAADCDDLARRIKRALGATDHIVFVGADDAGERRREEKEARRAAKEEQRRKKQQRKSLSSRMNTWFGMAQIGDGMTRGLFSRARQQSALRLVPGIHPGSTQNRIARFPMVETPHHPERRSAEIARNQGNR
jgi:hypothetical protein